METVYTTGGLIKKPNENYLPQSEINRIKNRVGFNGLTPTEWASLSKNVWNDVSSPRNQYQLEHGAVYPVKLAKRLIKMYSQKGDVVFDPFSGIGTTLIAAQNRGRNGIGIELNPRFSRIAEKWLFENKSIFDDKYNYKVINNDCRNFLQYVEKEKIQVTITSPPYANFTRKSLEDRTNTHKNPVIAYENNSTVKPYSDDEKDFGNLAYDKFLVEIKTILKANFEVTKNSFYSAWVVKDYRETRNKIPYVSFHSDLSNVGVESGFKFHDLIIWNQTGQRKLILLV